MFAALPLAWRIGAPIGLVLAIIGGYLAWQYKQQSIGAEREKAEHDAQIIQQQQEALGHFIVSAARKLYAVERATADKDRVNARLRQSYQEVVSHEQREQVAVELPALDRPACAVSPDLVRTVNGLARLLDDVSSERAASAGGTAGEPAGSRGGSAAGADRAGDGGGSGETDPRAHGTTEHAHH